MNAGGLVQPHHDGSALHVADQAPTLGGTVPVFVRVPHTAGVDRLWVRTVPDGEPEFAEGMVDRRTGWETWWRADVPVRNPLARYRFLLDGPGGYRWLTGTGVRAHDVPDATDFRLSAHPPAPAWVRDAVVYQIFPDRFARSAAASTRVPPGWAEPAGWDDPVAFRGPSTGRQLYGGDLDGITEHLDHIDALGADTLYLTPFFPAESNHRYDATSFDEVDQMLGGDAALVRLAEAVHRRGWRIIGDLTTNHTGRTHPWFRTALADRAAPERDFYYFHGADGDEYEGWLGVPTLPKLRFARPELWQRLVDGPGSAVRRWLQPPYELDGWRVDVANMTGRRGADDANGEVARGIRRAMADIGPDLFLLAEHAHDASAELGGDGWHGTMNYAGFTRPVWSWLRHPEVELPFLGMPVDVPRWSGEQAVRTLREFCAVTPWAAWASSVTLLGSHDTARIRTVVRDPDLVEVAAGLLFTLPGVPMVFAGDEIGIRGVLGEDARRPMPWHRHEWWDAATFERYRTLTALRRRHTALRHGGLRWVHAGNDVLVYLRECAGERLLVLAARAPHRPVRVPAAALGLVDGGRSGEAAPAYGGSAPLRAVGETVTLPGDGPALHIWQLP